MANTAAPPAEPLSQLERKLRCMAVIVEKRQVKSEPGRGGVPGLRVAGFLISKHFASLISTALKSAQRVGDHFSSHKTT